MMRDVTELFRPRAGTGDARLGRLRSPCAEYEGEAEVPLAGLASCIGSMLGDPRDGGSWVEDGMRRELREVDTSTR